MHAKKLRDAVHKDIQLGPCEVAALDTAQMQRLRGIRQLGAAYYVYPSAHHTRFEHGLGTYWMARRIMEEVERGTDFRFQDAERRAVLLAALVHDVTHIPFGHTFEDERRLLDRHDRSLRRYDRLIAGGELGDLLARSEPGRLALRLLKPGSAPPPERAYLRDIFSGTVCADLLDYLKRDNYFCGLSYEFDERIFHYFRVAEGRLALDMQHAGLLRRDALSEVTNLLRIRYVLSERVYYHHAKIAAGVMISKAVEHALNRGMTEDELCSLTDGTLIYRMREQLGGRELTELLDDFEARRLFKRCYMVGRKAARSQLKSLVDAYHLNCDGLRDEAEASIARAIGTQPHRVAIYCAPAQMALKEADIPVLAPHTGMTLLSSINSDEVRVLKRQHRALWRLYVFVSGSLAGRLVEAGRAAEEVIGLPNELPL